MPPTSARHALGPGGAARRPRLRGRLLAAALLAAAGWVPAQAQDVPDVGGQDVPDVGGAPDVPDLPGPDQPPSAEGLPSADEGRTLRSRIPFQLRAGTVLSSTSYRDPDFPPDARGPDWSSRLDLRLFGHPSLGAGAGLLANIRVRTEAAEGQDYHPEEDSNLDVQELALDFRVAEEHQLEVGRINVRGGVATGFNPTDWFKDDSLVVVDSFDVLDRREDRLGTVVVQDVWHTDRAVLVAGYRPEAPNVEDSWLTDADVVGLQLDRTNGEQAVYAKLTPATGTNLSTTLSAIYEPHEPGVGVEVSAALSETVVVFGEWFGQHRRSLVDESRRAAPLSPDLARELGADGERRFRHQLATGVSWSLPFSIAGDEDITLTGEYHYNGAGLSDDELDAFFEAGEANPVDSGPLGAIRGVAGRRQEPLAEHQLFLRFSWADIVDPWPGAVDDMGFGVIAFVPFLDGSALVEVSVDAVAFTDGRVELSAYTTLGDDDSIYGSQAADAGVRLALAFSF